MGQQPQVQSYLREDLKYLSLLIDDRARGFYNNPLSEKNDTKNFIEKISGELQASLPSETESSYFFDNTEVSTAGISNKNIYLRLVQDHLISKIKDNTGVNKESKIDAIAGVDLDTLQESV